MIHKGAVSNSNSIGKALIGAIRAYKRKLEESQVTCVTRGTESSFC